jgi:hypothetical protein
MQFRKSPCTKSGKERLRRRKEKRRVYYDL